MKQYATFDKNGNILAVVTTNTDQLPDETYVEIPPNLDVGSDTHYIDIGTSAIKKREEMNLNVSYGALSATVTNLPGKSKVFACGQETMVEDGTLTITLDVPELINVIIDAGPEYIKEDMEIQID